MPAKWDRYYARQLLKSRHSHLGMWGFRPAAEEANSLKIRAKKQRQEAYAAFLKTDNPGTQQRLFFIARVAIAVVAFILAFAGVLYDVVLINEHKVSKRKANPK